MAEPAVTRQQARELDRRAIEDFGIPSFTLMENAARACADECERILRIHGVQHAMDRLRAPGSKDDIPRNLAELEQWKAGLSFSRAATAVLCGPGNNGGDGLALARTLHNRGHRVDVFFCGAPDTLDRAPADVRLNARLLAALGIEPRFIATGPEAGALRQALADCPLIVDALFGTGLTRPVEDPQRAAIQIANECPATRLAVDIPSGLCADTGNVLGVVFRADVTVTFVARKRGFDLGAGPASCGKVVVAEIGVPRQWLDNLK
ncbi:MAG: NAD(P)H-hydrate epimerase [Planctomycetes bacterium]|jgi:NAD(P)H-hydrate epimerase|nr:NAD(P)H-hydrate epimerase [Planctomycetota bacterium]MCL4729036.1 NAD(P)H-hydrate epimerase [Planctomycetota bacterium]